MSDPKVLPTMIVGDDEDPIKLDEIVEAALSSEELRALWTEDSPAFSSGV